MGLCPRRKFWCIVTILRTGIGRLTAELSPSILRGHWRANLLLGREFTIRLSVPEGGERISAAQT